MVFFFFFSSRRRHTRCSRDWSSDVCSSDLTTSSGCGSNVTSRLVRRPACSARRTTSRSTAWCPRWIPSNVPTVATVATPLSVIRSEEHTSELQSRLHLVCRLLLEKKKNKDRFYITTHNRHSNHRT